MSKKQTQGPELAPKMDFKCETCMRTFKTKAGLKNHKCIVCDNCGKIFKKSSQLKRHVKEYCHVVASTTSKQDVTSTTKPLVCDVCQKVFLSSHHLNQHKLTHKGERSFKCSDCDKRYNSSSHLNRHKQSHSGNRLRCPVKKCEKSYIHRYQLNEHIRKIHKNSTGEEGGDSEEDKVDYKCDGGCNRTFGSQHALKIHKSLTQGKCGPLTCEICGKDFKFPAALREHLRTHTGEKPYPCNQCRMSFSKEYTLKQHVLTVHNVNGKIFQCVLCEKKFATEPYLKTHMRTVHQADSENINVEGAELLSEQFPCKTCPRVFYSSLGLKMHTDSGTCGPIECDVCGKNYKSAKGLRQHKLIHTGDKLFKCDECEQSFNLESYLKQHKQTHSRSYECKQCGRTFALLASLNIHVQINHSFAFLKVGKCKYCFKGFFRAPVNLRIHERNCKKKDDWKCAHCETLFKKKKLYIEHVRSFCPNRIFLYKCYCGTLDEFNPENVNEVLSHVIKCKPFSDQRSYKCYICNSSFQARLIPLHIQDELLHSRLIAVNECKHECVKCLVSYPSEQLLNLHTKVEHPCLSNFINKYKEPVDDISFSVNNKDLLIQERENNRKLEIEDLKFDGKYPESKCYICFLPLHSSFMKRRHLRFCRKKYGVDPPPTEKPSTLPPSKYDLRKQRGKVIHSKLTTLLAQKLFHRIKFDLNSCLKTWVQKVGSTEYWDQLAWEFRIQPYLVKKWLTTFTKPEKEKEGTTYYQNKELILSKLPEVTQSEPEISILIDWEQESKNKQFVTIDLTAPEEDTEISSSDIMKAKASGVFFRKCTNCNVVCTSLEEYNQHNHKTAMRYFRRKHTGRVNKDKPRGLKVRRPAWIPATEGEPGPYDDLSSWIFDGRYPKYRCEICQKPFHGRFMKHAHMKQCRKIQGIMHRGVLVSSEENDQILAEEYYDQMQSAEDNDQMQAEEYYNQVQAEEEKNRMETDEVASTNGSGPRLVLVTTD